MDGTHHHQRLHEGHCKNVAMAATGKEGPSGMPTYVPREDYPRDSPWRQMHGHGAVAVAAEGKEVRGTAGSTAIFVPDARSQGGPSRPAFTAPAAHQRARPISENHLPLRHIEHSPSWAAFTGPAAYPSPDQRPTTTLAASSASWQQNRPDQRPTSSAQVSLASVGSKNATSDSEEEDHLPVPTREGLANSSQPVSAGSPTAAAGQSTSARAPGGVGNNSVSTSFESEDGARRDDANAIQSIPTAPAMAARPSPAAQATPAPGGNSGTTSGKNQRKEATFCERLLSCFGLCS